MKPTISLIAAVSKNMVIGKDNKMPWHLTEDLQYFKKMTLGKPIIMGRKNHQSIGQTLPKRHNIILTRSTNYFAEGCTVVYSLEDALDAASTDADEIMIIGGGDIYKLFLPMADKLYITEIDKVIEGDVYFPEFDRDEWQQTSKTPGVSENGINYHFVTYEKRDGIV